MKVHAKGFHINFITQLHLPYKRDGLGMPYNGDKKIIMTFLRIDKMSFYLTNLKSIIYYKNDIIKTSVFKVHNLTISFKVSHKKHLNKIHGLI